MRGWTLALVPAVLVCLGMVATVVGAGFEHEGYAGMGCGDTRAMPGSAAAFYTLALVAGIAALTLALVPGAGIHRRQRPERIRRIVGGTAMVVAVVVTAVIGSLYGPRDQHGRDPIAGPVWTVSLLAAFIPAVTIVCGLSLWSTRGTGLRRGWLWGMGGFGALVSVVVLGAIGHYWWLNPHALEEICWYG